MLWQALETADLVKLAREELEYLKQGRHGDEEIVARLLRASRLVGVTDGAAPIRWWTRNDSGELEAIAVQAVDTTAAGDAFIGGLLSRLQQAGVDASRFDGLLEDHDALARCLRYGAACGALAVTRHGAFAALPTHAEACALLDGAGAVESTAPRKPA